MEKRGGGEIPGTSQASYTNTNTDVDYIKT